MSREQAARIEQLLRDGPLDLGGPLAVQRPLLEQLMTSHPLPDGVAVFNGQRGGIMTVETLAQQRAEREAVLAPPTPATILYFHGGAYAMGSARAGAGLLAGMTARTGIHGVSVEYRLAPEHPYPAGLDDAVAAYEGVLEEVPAERLIVAGESAGGGLALAALMAIRDRGRPAPAGAVLFSPWVDLTLSGRSISMNAERDAALTATALRVRADDYARPSDQATPGASPLFGDFSGLPPLLVQVGGNEILLDDAVGTASAAARADVPVTLEVTPHMPHVFQGFADDLAEGAEALDRAAAFVAQSLRAASR